METLLRFLGRHPPREGWLVGILVWLALLCVPGAAISANLAPGLSAAPLLVTIGLALGWWLGRRRLHGAAAAPLLVVAGALGALVWGVRAVAPLPLIVAAGRWAEWWLALRISRPVPLPSVRALLDQWLSLAAFAERVGWWVAGLTGGRGTPDNLVVLALYCLLAWSIAAWAGWWMARRGHVFLALMPAGALLAFISFLAGKNLGWLLLFLVLLPPLLAFTRYGSLQRDWEQAGVDYSPELRLSTAAAAVALTVGLLLVTPLLPAIADPELARAFWRRFESPVRQVEAAVSSSFPAVVTARSLIPPAGVAPSGLPRSHLLGGDPQLGREQVMRVAVRGALPDDRLYWRGETFAYYTGLGWDVAAAGEHGSRTGYPAGQSWRAESSRARHLLVATVQMIEGPRNVLYAPAEPLSADRPYTAWANDAGELVALQLSGDVTTYTVLSAASNAGERMLRVAGSSYPESIRRVYLQLPDGLDPQLAATAGEWTAGAATPYDEALALQSRLRQIPYTLAVPPPPAGREPVAWFLFELRQGYCDYYASAMVVLARLRGIPARLAIGYHTGTWDEESGEYRVTELDAHSWPELYFPGYGWLPFEPTAAQPPAAYPPGEAGFEEPEEPELAGRLAELEALGQQHAQQSQQQAIARLAVQFLLAAAAIAAAALYHSATRPLVDQKPYERFARWGSRMGFPPDAADTSLEYACRIAGAAPRLAERAAAKGSAARAAWATQQAAPNLAADFSRRRYGRAEADDTTGENESRRWRSLWSALRRLWLARWFRI